MQVRLGGVPRVPAARDRLALGHLLADAHLDRPPLQVGQRHEAAPGQGDGHAVAGDGVQPLAQPAGLAERVGQQRQLRAPPRVVGLAVVDVGDGAGARGEHGAAEAREALGRLGGQQSPPVADGGRAAAVVDRDEVDGVALGEDVDAVAGHAPGRAVLHEPAALERQADLDLARRRHALTVGAPAGGRQSPAARAGGGAESRREGLNRVRGEAPAAALGAAALSTGAPGARHHGPGLARLTGVSPWRWSRRR